MATATQRLLDRFYEELRQGPADFCSLVAEELPVITIGEWMHIPPKDYDLLRSLTHDQVHIQELFPSSSQLALSDQATAQLRDYFDALIRERRRSPGDDPISSWLEAWDSVEADQASADQIVHALAIFMVLAALETTSHLLSTVVYLLLEDADRFAWLRSHPDSVPGAVEEALRYDAPIHMISRVASTDRWLGGEFISQGQMVQLMIGASHHDPDHYLDPQKFDPRRGAQHLAFGTGAHYCLGNALARMEACVLLEGLLRLPGRLRMSAPPLWEPRVAFRRMVTLPLALT
ncbi:cytochrome P450 [Streptomyces sp. NPDC002817]|uniref:cytochrome P450 n=1 Tax=Streptomyces sp. NPDC088357 TaxID=3154655 RepID=UPI0034222D37